MIKTPKLLSYLAVGAIALFASASAHAVAILTLQSGSQTVSLSDTDNDGRITFNGTVGDFTFNLTSATTKPAQGSVTRPFLTLGSTDMTGILGSTLTITFTDDGFIGTSAGSLSSTISGSTDGSVVFSTLVNGVAVTTSPTQSGDNFANTQRINSQASFSGTFAQRVVVTQGAFGTTSFQATSAVPDGGSAIALLGIGMVGLEGFRRKFKI